MPDNVKPARARSQRIRRARARWFREKVGPLPQWIITTFADVPGNIEPLDPKQLTPEERAPRHVVELGEEPSFNDAAFNSVRAKRAENRKIDRDYQITVLAMKYPDRWGKRGQAKTIAFDEANEGTSSLTARTIQRYFKIWRLRRRHA